MPTIERAWLVTVRQKASHELREFLFLALYLYVCFSALVLYKMAILDAQGISFSPFGLPIVKALLLAKFIMLGHAVRLGDRDGTRRVIYVIVHKALLYLALLILLSLIEEAVVALIHGQTIVAAFTELWSGKLWQILANNVIMLLILVPYLASRELNDAVEGRLWVILLEPRIKP
ncbi:hypothetical protein [Rhizobium tubonense]|uniref:Uncharacterized protein n=1 Tax=Rhizobium tubonense TaxID=484088 RepID=A0A2W4C7M6_9HYPH|nr:hypothetical protein [Rhizobium tubonense]PZM09529.1 hypothetical protein CPY51_24895 [Rhizobium tubonense]